MRKLACLLLLLVSTASTVEFAFAGDKELYKLVQGLISEVELLRSEIGTLSDKVDRAYFAGASRRKSWQCYMEDMQAGRIKSTGATKAEAQSMVLDKCSQKGGICFESNIECIKE